MTTTEDQAANEMLAETLVELLRRSSAANELADLGITASPEDVRSWTEASPRDKRRFAQAWHTYVSAEPPAWKAR